MANTKIPVELSSTPGIVDNSNATAITIDSSERVGIGTTSPSSRLDIVHNNNNPLRLQNSTGVIVKTQFEDNASRQAEIALNTGSITFSNGTSSVTERMRIDSSGNVGIGQTSPYNLSVFSSLSLGGTSGKGGLIQIKHTNDTARGYLYAQSDAITLESVDTNIIRFVTNAAERARLDTSGRLLINTTNPSPANIGNHYLVVERDASTFGIAVGYVADTVSRQQITFYNNNGTVGSIATSGSSTAYNTSSDARLKDVTGEARGLEVINELNPVAYNWKESGQADEGLIAQEVLDIVPNAVTGSEEKYYQMDYSKLVVHLVKGIKEQQAQIEALQSEINELKNS